jgi:two-component system response regulator (stage 0 sporulation protein F)
MRVPLPSSTAHDEHVMPHAPVAAEDVRQPAIVLVDDEPDVLIILHRMLRDRAQNYALIAVGTAQAALSNIALCAVPLLITDYHMIGMNGLQLIAAVKRISPQTCTVLITAYDTPELQRSVQTALVDHYLAKPFRLERLDAIVRKAVQ